MKKISLTQIAQIKRELSNQNEEELLLVFCLITESGFTLEDFQSLRLSDLKTIEGDFCVFTRYGERLTIPRKGIEQALKQRVLFLREKGVNERSKIFATLQSTAKNRKPHTERTFEYLLNKIKRLTDSNFTYLELLNCYRYHYLKRLIKLNSDYTKPFELPSISEISERLDVHRATLYRWIEQTPELKNYFKSKPQNKEELKERRASLEIMETIDLNQFSKTELEEIHHVEQIKRPTYGQNK